MKYWTHAGTEGCSCSEIGVAAERKEGRKNQESSKGDVRVGAAPCHPPPDAMVPYMGWPVWRGERDGAARMCTFFRTYMLFRTYLYVFLFHSRQYQWRHQLKLLFRASQTIHFAVKHSLSARVSFLINFANFQQTEWLFFRTPNYAVHFFLFCAA